MAQREEIEAALEARRELGKTYEDEIVDGLVEKIERRLEQRGRAEEQPPPEFPMVTPLALGSIGAGVGATAIATDMGGAGTAVAIVAWIAIAVVNVAYARWRR